MRPWLRIDLKGEDSNVFVVMLEALQLLTGETRDQFIHDMSAARQPDAGKHYKDLLEIINSYVRLLDTSGTYPEYAWNEQAIIAAVKHLNEQIETLPQEVSCLVEEAYPEFDSPEYGPETYLALVEQEIERVEMEGNTDPDNDAKLLAMLKECAQALKAAGV